VVDDSVFYVRLCVPRPLIRSVPSHVSLYFAPLHLGSSSSSFGWFCSPPSAFALASFLILHPIHFFPFSDGGQYKIAQSSDFICFFPGSSSSRFPIPVQRLPPNLPSFSDHCLGFLLCLVLHPAVFFEHLLCRDLFCVDSLSAPSWVVGHAVIQVGGLGKFH